MRIYRTTPFDPPRFGGLLPAPVETRQLLPFGSNPPGHFGFCGTGYQDNQAGPSWGQPPLSHDPGQEIEALKQQLLLYEPESPISIATQGRIAALQDQQRYLQISSRVEEAIPTDDPDSQAIKSLLLHLSETEPESPQALAIAAKLDYYVSQTHPEYQEAVTQITQEININALDNISEALKTISSNLEPDSPTALALEARLAAIDTLKSSLQAQYQVQQVLPGYDELSSFARGALVRLANLEPESPQASILEKILKFVGQQTPALQEPIQRALQLQKSVSLDNLKGSLYTILSNLEPESPAALALQSRIAAIDALKTAQA